MSERELDEASLCKEFVAVHSQAFLFILESLAKDQRGRLHKWAGANSRNDGRR